MNGGKNRNAGFFVDEWSVHFDVSFCELLKPCNRKDAKTQRKRKGKQNNLRLKSNEVHSRATAIYRPSGANRNSPLFDTLRLVFSAYPLRLCVFAVKV